MIHHVWKIGAEKDGGTFGELGRHRAVLEGPGTPSFRLKHRVPKSSTYKPYENQQYKSTELKQCMVRKRNTQGRSQWRYGG